jgi:chorismate synthase
VSSVGKVHLPSSIQPLSRVADVSDEDNDEAEDALSSEFRTLLATVTREEVDKFPTRCPHPETSDRMTKVCIDLHKYLSLKPPYLYLRTSPN